MADASPSEDRDYLSEMDRMIEKWTPKGDYVPAVVAAKLMSHLAKRDPDLFDGWAWIMGPIFLADVMRYRERRRRAQALQRHDQSVFATDAAKAEGDTAALALFRAHYAIDAANTWRKLCDMTKPDCIFVADHYEHRAKANKFEEVFFRAIAAKLGDQKVSDVFTAEQILAMRGPAAG